MSSLVAHVCIKGAVGLTMCYSIRAVFVVLQNVMMFAVLMTVVYVVALLANLNPTGQLDALGVAFTMAADATPTWAVAAFVPFELVGVSSLSLVAAILTVGLLLAASK